MKYVVEIPDEDRIVFTEDGFINRINDWVQIGMKINSLVKLDDVLKVFEETVEEEERRDPKPGEEWKYVDEGIKCLVVKENYTFGPSNYDVIMSDGGGYFNVPREELIKPTGKTYPEIIKIMEGYVNEANS